MLLPPVTPKHKRHGDKMVDKEKLGRFLSKAFPRKAKRLKKATAVEALTIVTELLKKAELEIKRKDIVNAKKTIMGVKAVIEVMLSKYQEISNKPTRGGRLLERH